MDLAVGGAGLASGLIELGLIDEFRLFLSPVVLGGGTPHFPAMAGTIDLELLGTRHVCLSYPGTMAGVLHPRRQPGAVRGG